MLPALFSATIFLSATLLFSVQPVIAKMLLPLLGGTPAVWTTCMLFFQGALLAGYLYAHFISRRLTPRIQSLLHLAILAAAGMALPFGVAEDAVQSMPTQSNPLGWVLKCLLGTVGLPFFVISASAPLLQKWYSKTGQTSAADPYFLYAASNLGSLIALLSYPVLVEPNLRLAEQAHLWTAAYATLGLCFLLCSATQWGRGKAPHPSDDGSENKMPVSTTAKIGARAGSAQRFRWIALAFVPSSLMLGVTTYLTTDIASIPLLWIVPLAVYLTTFVIAFAKRSIISRDVVNKALPIGAIGLTYLILSEATEPVWLLVALHVAVFFVASMVCHTRLADERPHPTHLTEFYLCLSVGGVLGGVFNVLIAPNIFNQIVEYPMALVFACLFRPIEANLASGRTQPVRAMTQKFLIRLADLWQKSRRGSVERDQSPHPNPLPGGEGESSSAVPRTERVRSRDAIEPSRFHWLDWSLPVGLGLITIALAVWFPQFKDWPLQARSVIIFGFPLVLAFMLVDRPVRFGLGLSAILVASAFYSGGHGRSLHVDRNFFGVLRVTLDPEGTFRRLVHGNTVHGRQSLDPARQAEPLSYYHRSGPLGQVFKIFEAKAASTNVAVIGLGAGSMACYARPYQSWTYFEINPAVIRVAQNTNYFTFLGNSSAAEVRMIVGDARLRLREARDASYDLILLDAFSSDAIPVHLITREAIQLYFSKLASGGFLAFHISNRCLDLEPILGDLAGHEKLVCYGHDEIEPEPFELAGGKDQSHWVVIARRVEDLGRLIKDSRWMPIAPRGKPRVWTDDFSNIWSVFRWN